MHCAACAQNIEKVLSEPEWLKKVSVNFAAETAHVEYEADKLNLNAIEKAITEIGYGAEEKIEGEAALDRERAVREAEIRFQEKNLVISWSLGMLIMLGTFRDYWILSSFVPAFLSSKYVLFALTTPVVFCPGRQFFIGYFPAGFEIHYASYAVALCNLSLLFFAFEYVVWVESHFKRYPTLRIVAATIL